MKPNTLVHNPINYKQCLIAYKQHYKSFVGLASRCVLSEVTDDLAIQIGLNLYSQFLNRDAGKKFDSKKGRTFEMAMIPVMLIFMSNKKIV